MIPGGFDGVKGVRRERQKAGGRRQKAEGGRQAPGSGKLKAGN
jgi:hypothetical protein